jgi:hypothetical protein
MSFYLKGEICQSTEICSDAVETQLKIASVATGRQNRIGGNLAVRIASVEMQ